MNIKQLSAENRPRERLERQGSSALSSAELLALILKSGTQKENILEICQKLLAKYGLENLATCSLEQLMAEHGIGKAKACQIVALFELYRKLPQSQIQQRTIRTAQEAAEIYLPKLGHLKHEQFFAVYLDVKNKIIADEQITKGILNASLIHPREVFHGALKHLAHSLIVLHNHPSGDPTPSTDDLEITKRLQKTGEIMGIPLLDHIILGKDIWWSWKEHKA